MGLFTRRKSQRITIIACIDNGRGLGNNGELLYRLPIDMAMFKLLTYNNVVLMGSKTFESLGCKALPGRINVVLTHDVAKYKQYEVNNHVFVTDNTKRILTMLSDEHIYVIGGASVYKQFLQYADELVITHVNDVTYADTFFPDVNIDDWHVENIMRTNDNGHDICIRKYVRKLPLQQNATFLMI